MVWYGAYKGSLTELYTSEWPIKVGSVLINTVMCYPVFSSFCLPGADAMPVHTSRHLILPLNIGPSGSC